MATYLTDEQWMQQALNLAAQGIGLASPNPYVGAVIVDEHGAIIGSGCHTYAFVKHAEILAIEQAGERARGATLYINLEPCTHHGRTGPCADAVIAAGIRRVVASMPDPNPIVSGQGFAKLRAAGIEVEIGLLQDPARRLNEAFARYIRHRVPFVTLKSAMSLDGQIATAPNRTSTAHRSPDEWITGAAARAHVHQLRHQHDAILTGIGTVLADNPLLTDRSGLPRRRPLQRVVLDSRLRLPSDSRLVESVSKSGSDVIVFCASSGNSRPRLSDSLKSIEDHGIRVEQVPMSRDNAGLDLPAVLRRLAELEITSVLVEAGSRVNSAVLADGLADKLFLYYAPKFLRTSSSVPFASLTDSLDTGVPLRLQQTTVRQFADDFAIEGYLRDPYAD